MREEVRELPGSQRWSATAAGVIEPAAPAGDKPADTQPAIGVLPQPGRCPSVAQAIQERRRDRRGIDRQQALPSFLSSMVLHLLLVVVLGSLMIESPLERSVRMLILTAGAAEQPIKDAEPETLVFKAASPDTGDENHTLPPAPTAEIVTEVNFQSAGQPSDLANDLESWVGALEQVVGGRPQGPDRRPAHEAAPAPGLAAAVAARAPPPGDPRRATGIQPHYDDVVDRFIQYDIGNLSGPPGERARREFEALGPEAIPALVRGLNKSASISASCPILVISRKLDTALRQTNDPALLRYALENMGKDVPAAAPYARRIRSLKEKWLTAFQAQLMLNPEHTAKALDKPNRAQKLLAAQAVARQPDRFGEPLRTEVAWSLARLLTDSEAGMRTSAHQALVALAGGQDLGSPDSVMSSERPALAGRWYNHFDAERYESMAASLFNSAKGLEVKRDKTAAARYYRKLVREFPGTEAADQAGVRLDALRQR